MKSHTNLRVRGHLLIDATLSIKIVGQSRVWRHAFNVSTQEAEAEEPELELAWSMQQVPGQSTEIHSETLCPAPSKKRL